MRTATATEISYMHALRYTAKTSKTAPRNAMRTSETPETNAEYPTTDTHLLRFSCTSDFSAYISRFQPHYESKTNRRSFVHNIHIIAEPVPYVPRNRSDKSRKFSHTTVLSFIFKRSINRVCFSPHPLRYRLQARVFPNISLEKLSKFLKSFLYVHL